MVTDSLKTLRLLHQILLLVAAGVLVLGLTPDPSRAYSAALQELVALKKIEMKQAEYGSYLRNVPLSVDDDGQFFGDLLRATGAHVAELIQFPRPFASDYAFTGSRLADYDAFFTFHHEIAPIELDYDRRLKPSWVQYLRDQIAIQGHRQSVTFQKFHLDITGLGTQPDGTQIMQVTSLFTIPETHEGEGTLEFVFTNPKAAVNPRFAVPLAVRYRFGQVYSGTFALDWLRSTTAGEQLVDPKSRAVFPHLKMLDFWQSLSLMDVDAAASNLQRKLDSINTETLSFFGISVNKSVAVWAGPFACLCIGWLFLSHLRRFRVLAVGEASVQEYPWIALFPSRACGLTTYLSLVLPVGADALLLYRYGNWSEWDAWLGLAFTLGLAAIVECAIRELYEFRREPNLP